MPDPLLLAVIAVFGTVALAVVVVGGWLFTEASPERRRLRQTQAPSASGVLLDLPSLTPETSDFVTRASTFVPRSPKDLGRLRKRFMRAGYQTMTPVAVYTIGADRSRGAPWPAAVPVPFPAGVDHRRYRRSVGRLAAALIRARLSRGPSTEGDSQWVTGRARPDDRLPRGRFVDGPGHPQGQRGTRHDLSGAW